MNDDARLNDVAMRQPAFARTLGISILEASRERVVMELPVTEALSNRNGVMHGGAILGLTDNAGGTASSLNLKDGENTVTLESKVNFLRPIRIGDVARATVTPVHVGNTTQIWQIAVTRGDGKLAAQVTQTQMTIAWKEPAEVPKA
ncbi:PaaI family thioesterase [Paracoccus aerodenitrificans]|uniref:PaaI family thioesterase n=1 Tax=Paracoccus aerodenitrificans TaxID=3017781 RepID=UPI0022F114D5|nr:PaaI family thioesterase [Paracoccus aerodenitrificans]WBU64033.1 PaaI family thioesterase [Paracoccus aerodenitrificans]